MQRLNFLLTIVLLATGCAAQQTEPSDPGNEPEGCEGNYPANPSWIKYGKSELSVKETQSVQRKKVWRIHLQPTPNSGLDDALVIITGKTPDALTWINKSGKKSDDPYIWICVPDETSPGDYYFSVTVVGVGTIDPRVTVEE